MVNVNILFYSYYLEFLLQRQKIATKKIATNTRINELLRSSIGSLRYKKITIQEPVLNDASE